MKKAILAALLLSTTASVGCASYATVLPSTAGKAWAVRGGMFGSTYWNCDATKGEPTCYEVINAPTAPAGGAK